MEVSNTKSRRLRLPAIVFTSVFILLAFVQIKVQNPMLLAERFFKGSGWLEIFLISLYGAFVAWKMQDPMNVPAWRKITWTIFSLFFFSQLIIGITASEKFLMTGKLHLPIPMMIIAGPIYRGQLSVMTILFLSTILLTGPAWCSQFCYFGAFDNLSASGKTSKGTLKNKWAIKSTILIIVVITALAMRILGIDPLITTIMAVLFGLAGISVMILLSRSRKKMVHCAIYCPVGTLVNIFHRINPFRLYIENSCTLCMKCTSYCKYDALSITDIRNSKPGAGCTLCGDCLAACHHDSIKYGFLKMDPEKARKLYLILTITLHASFLALARI